MKQTYSGGCHCGTVRYEAEVDLSEGTVKCNCSICRKSRAWLAAIEPRAFRLMSGAEALTEYQFGGKRIHHLFCKHCGVKSFGRVKTPDGNEFVAICISCLDDVSDADLAALPVVYVDGLQDNFMSAPAETRHL
jgi:hypothetical protein